MRRRMKKMQQLKARGIPQFKIKRKFKYETRSVHARNRKRAKDGKFLSGPEINDDKTASTVLKDEEVPIQEERVPCYAQEESENQKPKGKVEDKVEKVKFEMDNITMNSDDLVENIASGLKDFSKKEDLDEPLFEDEPQMRRYDSLFNLKP